MKKFIFILITIIHTQNVYSSNSLILKCDNCSTSTMEFKAKQKAIIGGRTVHIFSSTNNVIKSYHSELIEELDFNPPFIDQYVFEIATDNAIKDSINYALSVADTIENMSGTTINDLPGGGYVDSAIDLPGNSLALTRIQNGISDNLAALFFNSSLTFGEHVTSFVNVTLSLVAPDVQHIVVTFGDGSQYTFLINGSSISANTESEIIYTIVPVVGSGRDGNNNPIPESGNQLSVGGAGVSFTVSQSSVTNWLYLISRLEGSNSPSYTCSFECSGNHCVISCVRD